MSLTPFEIRLELLKMAKDMLTEDFHTKREQISNNWNVTVENSRHSGTTPPDHPALPPYPTEAEVIAKASTLNGFVSALPQDAVRKSTKA
jgi:hypothetical protein